jgi:hypothetical protein
MRREVFLQPGDAGVFGVTEESGDTVVVDQSNPVSVIGIRQTGRRHAGVVELLDERSCASVLLPNTGVVNTPDLIGRIPPFERSRNGGGPFFDRDASHFEKSRKRATGLFAFEARRVRGHRHPGSGARLVPADADSYENPAEVEAHHPDRRPRGHRHDAAIYHVDVVQGPDTPGPAATVRSSETSLLAQGALEHTGEGPRVPWQKCFRDAPELASAAV